MHPGPKTLLSDQQQELVGVVLGTRPSIIMLAPVIKELARRGVPHFVIHTGQHYSPQMDAELQVDLGLREPDCRLAGVAERKLHGAQTAAMLEGIESLLIERRPCLLLVGGDANTNLAGALAARKLGIGVGHIEAGERSYDWQMPEEHNRVMIDHISDLLFVTGGKGVENLRREGLGDRAQIVGNPIVDASLQNVDRAGRASKALDRFSVAPGAYAILTAHREENVDRIDRLRGMLAGASLAAAAIGMPVLMLAHPRTERRLVEFGLDAWARTLPGLRIETAVRYLDFLNLLVNCRLVFTDSGGVQQEACIHRIPCVTLRDNTEWTETIDIGANRLAGCNPDRIAAAAKEAIASPTTWSNPFGDGNTAARIADTVEKWLEGFRSSVNRPARRRGA